MTLAILIAVISLISLIILHEFGHFILAKIFRVKVEEFGIFLPPRLIGKKIGQTIYSLNSLPFGAFVKLYGEEDHQKKEDFSFSQKPIWQRVLIVLAGVVSFWLIAVILLIVVMALGAPTLISDEANSNLVNPRVQIINLAIDSPAQKVGLKPGDIIKELRVGDYQLKINKIKEVQEFSEKYKGKEIFLTIERGKETFEVSLVPRVSPPEGQGPMGVALARIIIKRYPWSQAVLQGILATGNLTVNIIQGLGKIVKNLIWGKGLPPGVQLMGPIGIFGLFTQIFPLGLSYFLNFVAVISIYLAIFNILPIPALDGGKLLFFGIEAIRKKPLSQKIERDITAIFFTLLISLMIWVTIKDIVQIF